MHIYDLHEDGRALYAAGACANVTSGYYYDWDVVRSRVRMTLGALPANVHLLYSFKANPLPDLVTLLASEGCGADVSSGAELLLALRCGFVPEIICFVGPGKSTAELALAVEHNIGAVVVESEEELDVLGDIATARQRRINTIMRINPSYEVRGVRMAMGGRTTQFGLEDTEVLRLMRANGGKHSAVNICGIHTYAGTRIASAADAAWNVGQVIAQARQLGEAGFPCAKIDVGGGLGIPYYEGEQELDFAEFATALQKNVRAYETTGLPPCTFYLESGRFVIGPAGCFFARVNYATVSGDTQHVEISATPALHGLSAGSLLARNRLFLGAGLHNNGWKRGNIPTAVWYRVHGQRLPWPTRVIAPRMSIDDYLIFLNSGAYGPTTSAVWHNLEGFPAEFAGEGGRIRLVNQQMARRTLAQGQQVVAGYA